MSDPIKDAELAAARLRLHRHVAATLIQAMATSDTSFGQIDESCGWTEGYARRWLIGLIDGDKDGDDLNTLSDFCWAMGCVIEVLIQPRFDSSPLLEPSA